MYRADARFSESAATLFSLDLGAPEPLPDALRGEKWAFVQLPLGPLLDMLKAVDAGDLFGAAMDLKSAGLDGLPRDVLVPGVAVFSRRATPLAAWTNGLEIAGAPFGAFDAAAACCCTVFLVCAHSCSATYTQGKPPPTHNSITPSTSFHHPTTQQNARTQTAVKADVDRSCLILETGVNQRWRYGGWRPSPDSIEEAQGWEEAKEGTR